MEWRCEWCGKPHAEDDPPCDNCGHGKFEKAVVRRTDLAEGEGLESTLVWVCTDCGREHPKHAPPCSRCGNTTLEKQEQRVSEDELTAPGYLDLVTPRYIATLGLTLAVAAVLILGFVGVLDLPGFDQGGVPTVDTVPGNETTAGDVDLDAVEDAYILALNDRLEAEGTTRLDRSDGLDAVTTYYHQQVINWRVADGPPPDDEEVTDLLLEECETGTETPIEFHEATIAFDGTEDTQELADSLVTEVIERQEFEPAPGANTVGVDVHAVGDRLFLGQFVCER